MSTIARGLRALGHPASVAAVGALLLNDHVLKAAIPSWVTGKLSDFAGLFFFPFLLVVMTGAVERLAGRRAWPPRLVGGICFGVTAVWFAGMKTVPAVNEWTAAVAGWFVGGPVVIVLDPTDVMALAALWPAWRVWSATVLPHPRPLSRWERGVLARGGGERRPGAVSHAPLLPSLHFTTMVSRWERGVWARGGGERPGRRAYAVLCLAVLATIATSPCAPPRSVTRLAVDKGAVYALLASEGSEDDYAVSVDGGREWEWLEEAPEAVTASFGDSAAASRLVCRPDDARACYQLAAERVEESSDGGQTWQTAWEIPAGRRTFMDRILNLPLSCRGENGMDIGPYDAVFVDEPGGTALVVAMGTQGVLVLGTDGRWERYGVQGATPVPFSGVHAFVILTEVVLSLVAAIVAQLGLTVLGWARLPQGGAKIGAGAWLIGAGFVVFIIGLVGIGLQTDLGLAGMGLGVVLVALGLLAGWVGASDQAAQPGRVWGMAGVSVLVGFVVAAAPIGLLCLWMAGTIPWYGVALGAALVIGVGAVVWGVATMVKLSQDSGQKIT